MNDDIQIPKFQSEAEEAHWWDAHPEYVLQQMQKAKAEGRLSHGTAMRRIAEREAIRLDPEDLSLAITQAKRKGLEFQTYLRMLIHEALLTHSNEP